MTANSLHINLNRFFVSQQAISCWRKIAGVGVVSLLLTACGSGNPDANVAQQVVDQFYQAQIQQNDAKAVTFFSSKKSPDECKAHLQQVRQQLGQLKSYHIKHDEVNTVLRGRYYIFDVQTEYVPGGIAAETVTVFNEVGSDETSIVSQTINHDKLSLTF